MERVYANLQVGDFPESSTTSLTAVHKHNVNFAFTL